MAKVLCSTPPQVLAIVLPREVHPPKYQMFQRVKQGTIVGIEWVSTRDPDYLPGWWYAIKKNRRGYSYNYSTHEDRLTPLD